MPSLKFDDEKSIFRDFHTSNHKLLEDAKDSFIALINSLLIHAGSIAVSKIEGRVKDREECIKKFSRKYLTTLESNGTPYAIRDYITDLIGLRVVCLYEDDIERVEECLSEHFDVIEKTNKIAQIENTEGSFGYKGLHLDLQLSARRKSLPEYVKYAEFRFEIQIRTIIQDSWSVLDHKIKYKKSIPTKLKRRINTLAALFELADREFREIRDSTVDEIEKEQNSGEVLDNERNENQDRPEREKINPSVLNAFSFLRIAKHFFNDFEFEAHKVDGFTQEIIGLEPEISRGKFNEYIRDNLSDVKLYQVFFEKLNPNDRLNPYTLIRHCLFKGNKSKFDSILTNAAKENFLNWLNENRREI